MITGGGSGIGAAIAQALANRGMRVALCGRTVEKLGAVAAELRTESLCLQCDVRVEADIAAAVAAVDETWGQLDVLVNNAGVFDMKPLEETDTEYWDAVLETNLRGTFLFCRTAWPLLKAAKGQVVQISSVAGTRGFANGAAYCASKFGMNGLSEVLRIEGKPHGIRVITICPGSVETPLWEPHSSTDERSRMIKPETIAELAAGLLASPRGVDYDPVTLTNFQSPFEG